MTDTIINTPQTNCVQKPERLEATISVSKEPIVNNAPAKQVALRASKRGKILAGYSLLFSLSLLDILHTS